MPGSYPRADELPAEFAVFPLPGALLLPRGKLPLNIFEPRYLAMTEDSLGAGRMFGMIQPDESRPAGDTGPALYKVGCLGRIVSFSETEDGRYLISLAGVIRFAVAEELAMARGYRRVRGDFSAYLGDLAETSGTAGGVDRSRLVDATRRYFTRRGFDTNWKAIDAMDEDDLVGTLSMVCPFEPAEKQALLEAQADRGHILLALLEMGAAGPTGGSDHHSAS